MTRYHRTGKKRRRDYGLGGAGGTRSPLRLHQLIGRADVLFEESAVRLAEAGHRDEAAPLWRSLVGRDVLERRWTFEIVVRFDDDHYDLADSEDAHLE
ncbi:MAG: hypothetical protein M3Q30_25950 [Actinomycetota bacterium]|nr:hypothetical protein [Actinomycetota bacterium]